MSINQKLVELLDNSVKPLSDQSDCFDKLIEKIGDKRFVLIGEASHGTHEFYQMRAGITKALIQKKGFMAVSIEGDWPDTYRINRYVQGAAIDSSQALEDFKRFPAWMWRNQTVLPFIEWLRQYNDGISTQSGKVGFYGLDLYSLNSSMAAVISYLEKVDPASSEHARERYACFDHLGCDPQTYGYLVTEGLKKNCVKEAVDQLLEMQYRALDYIKKESVLGEDEFFYAWQNALVVRDAEKYYRCMFEGRLSTWNIRDQHMLETLNALADHLENKTGKPAKIIVWAHNSHVGDARATEMNERGEVNLGQLTREHHPNDTYLIGFSTYQGVVMAANGWDQPGEYKNVNPGLLGSYEALFHQLRWKNFMLFFNGDQSLEHYLRIPRLQRAIGVIYRPETERASHYFFTRLPYQFDCIIHIDQTSAVCPLDPS